MARGTGFVAAAMLLASIGAAGAADSAKRNDAPSCAVPTDLTRLERPLARTARKLAAGEKLTIVAIGSSSTAGAGASSPAATYPARLEVELKTRFPNKQITVLNRGTNGEDAREMLARFEQSVMAEHPDLVLWQVGTNALLFDRSLDNAGALVVEGIDRLKDNGVDVVLIDPQFAPKVLAKPAIGKLMDFMSVIAKRANVADLPALRGDAPLARSRGRAVQRVPVAGRIAHERLELWLRGQAPGRFDRGRSHPLDADRCGPCRGPAALTTNS